MEYIHISLVSIVFLLNSIFAFRVYFSDKKNPINKSFALFALITAVWIIIDFTLYQQGLAAYQTFLNRLNLSVIIFLIYTLTYFVYLFPNIAFKIPRWLILCNLIFAVLLSVAIVTTKYAVTNAYMQDYGSNFNQGSLFLVFAIYGVLLTLFSIVLLIIKLIRSRGVQREQIKFVFYGIGLFLLFNIIFNLFIPVMTKSFLYGRFGTYSAIFLVFFIAYAILKTGLFNLKIILTEASVVIINVILITQIFTSHSEIEVTLRIVLSLIVLYGSYLLVQSVKREIKLREELQGAMEKLKELNKKLKEMDAMKTEFVSMASHELLTPISAIEGYLSMIVDEHLVKIEDPKAQKFLANIYSSSKRLARLVGDLLNVSRIEQGRLLMQKTIVDVDALVNSVITELKFRAQERQMTMTPDFRIQGAQASSFADADKIKEILVNLTGNSIKYTQKGGQIVIAVDLWPTAQVEQRYQAMAVQMKTNGHTGALQRIANAKLTEPVGDHQIVVSVADNGIGIAPQDIGHLFQKFSRVGDWSTQEVQGTGLGLYISRALVEMHHGKIWAESPGEKKGTIFYFSLPLAQFQQQILQLDNQVPQSRDAKPLARMGGGPAAKV